MKKVSSVFLLCSLLFVGCSKKENQVEEPTFKLTTAISPDDSGIITTNVKDNDSILSGTKVTVTAEAKKGYFFVNWNGKDANSLGTENPITITVEEDIILTATFKEKMYLADNGVTVVAGEGAEVGYKQIIDGVEYEVVDSLNIKDKKDLISNTYNLCTSKVTDMSGMFVQATAFNGDLSTWDVSKVTDMSLMFFNATTFNGDLSNWDVSKVKNMSGMFVNATTFNGDISSWDVSKVTDMSSMFIQAGSFNQDLSGWNVDAVEKFTNFDFGDTAWLDEKKPKFTVE